MRGSRQTSTVTWGSSSRRSRRRVGEAPWASCCAGRRSTSRLAQLTPPAITSPRRTPSLHGVVRPRRSAAGRPSGTTSKRRGRGPALKRYDASRAPSTSGLGRVARIVEAVGRQQERRRRRRRRARRRGPGRAGSARRRCSVAPHDDQARRSARRASRTTATLAGRRLEALLRRTTRRRSVRGSSAPPIRRAPTAATQRLAVVEGRPAPRPSAASRASVGRGDASRQRHGVSSQSTRRGAVRGRPRPPRQRPHEVAQPVQVGDDQRASASA